MKQFLVLTVVLVSLTAAFGQKKDSTTVQPGAATSTSTNVTPKKKDWSKIDLSHRANDHFMVQIGYDNLAAKPDTLTTAGISRSFNFYFMLDFPFKTDPRLSVGAGLGIGNSNIFFKNQPSPLSSTPRADGGGGDHFKKYKIVVTYLEVPLELRFAVDPENTNKSWKFAIGAKVGTLLSEYAKGKNVENNANQTTFSVVEKQKGNQYYNSIKLAGTARISKGVFGLFGQFQATSLIKGAYTASPVYPFSIGICFSGL